MKNKLIFAIILLLPVLIFSMQGINEDEYIVKVGDSFLLQIESATSIDTLLYVLPQGNISIRFFEKSVKVSGNTLAEAKTKIITKIQKFLKNSLVKVELSTMSPFHYNLTGAVIRPGTYVSKNILRLNQVFHLSKGLAPIASKNISIFRNGEELKFNLNKFLQNGDKSQNPFVMDDDIVNVQYAKKYIKIYHNQHANADSVNFEYVDLENNDKIKLENLKDLLSNKSLDTDFSNVNVIRNNQVINIDKNSFLQHQDEVYFEDENNYIFVTGSVKNPNQFSYNPNFSLKNYLALAGGITIDGNRSKIYVIDKKGNKRIYKGQPLNPNETIFVKQDLVTLFNKYIKPVLTITTLIITYIQISN
ncbi:MAG: SLBB domain-containing protein [Candidatus Cloacimonadota bacterium]|nr:SLBB domain-containing protein [Candidatus Cloacimonadota bacterium]